MVYNREIEKNQIAEKGKKIMIWAILVVFIIAFDQITKQIASKNIAYGDRIVVIDKFLNLTYHENKGAAWGILQNGRYFFIVLTVIVSVALIYFLIKEDNILLRISLSFILGGALGNWIDRVVRGSVIDFIDLRLWFFHFNIFNVADTFITVGSIMLAVFVLFFYKEKKI
jgi:signal peptidase II